MALHANGQEEYVLKINDNAISIALDKPFEINVNGAKVKLMVSSKDTLTYSNDIFSFSYPKQFKVSTSKISEGDEQMSLITTNGYIFIMQKYVSMNPTKLNENALHTLTEESVKFGYKLNRSNYKRRLKSGEELVVTKAVLKLKDDINIYEVASYGKGNKGFIVSTIKNDDSESNEDFKIINSLWNSIIVH